MTDNKTPLWRTALVGIFAVLLSLVMLIRLLRLELSAPIGDSKEQSVWTKAYSYTTSALRGEILDRYGRTLVSNEITWQVCFDYLLWQKSTQNQTLLALHKFCGERGYTYTDKLPLALTEPEYTTDRSGTDSLDKGLNSFLKARKWAEDLSPAELMEKLRAYFGVEEELSYADARLVVGLRYDLLRSSFSTVEPFVFLADVSPELISAIEEHSGEFPGVRMIADTKRVYHTPYAAHLLGRVTGIYSGEYEALAEKGYKLTDRIGRDGVEQAFEEALRGIAGRTEVRIDSEGRVVEVVSEKPAQAGSNVVLTLDIRLQEVAERALAEQIAVMNAEAIENPSNPQDIGGGVAVVVDVNTGGVLASASYPTYDITKFSALYNQLLNDPLTPMLNRAIGGTYAPGSTFKMITSVAGLETGAVTPETVIADTGKYDFYEDYQPSCWIYSSSNGIVTHGDETLVGALRDSCNVYYYEVGRRVGIDVLAAYAKGFGLGQYTGIELPGERKGYVASPESKLALHRQAWVSGDTLSAAIGQSDNLFTPLQMANYLATLCNGGTRYESHLLKAIYSWDYGAVVSASQSVIADRVQMSPLTYATVMEGMSEVTENGTAAGVFANYDVHVGGKTGSAQVSSGTANGVFCAFAPFEAPEIAVVVIVEHAGSGNKIAPIALKIFQAYFAMTQDSNDVGSVLP